VVSGVRALTTIEPELLSAERLSFAAADRLYARAVLADDLAGIMARLDVLTASPDTAAACRASVLKAVLQWRDGQAEAAGDTVAAALTQCETTDALLLRARLLDIQGQAGAATGFYERARARSGDIAERTMIDRRLAVIGVTGRRPDALNGLAQAGPEAANRAAAVLGLLGRSDDALALYRPSLQGYTVAVRQADWAITAGDRAVAAAAAWRAFAAAATAEDRFYALALLVEAYRIQDDLAGAEADLAAHSRGPEVDQTRLDVLLELGRYDEAVAFAQASGGAALRERLLGVLRAAGRTDEVEAEYTRLIRVQPAEPRWSNDLATVRLQQGDADGAVQVYRAFFAANQDRPEAQIEAARRMIAMGLGDQAHALLRDAGARPELAAAVGRFEVEIALDQGRDSDADAGLKALRSLRPNDVATQVSVAEDYERLGRQDQALDTLLSIERAGGVLDDDQQAHIAELAYAAGRPEEALERWRSVWGRTQLPARKIYLQRLIIRAAQRLNRLDIIGAELEQRIAAGAADQGEVNLLVDIRIAQQDGPGAERAVRIYAERSNAGEVRALEQLASVQARMRNYPGLNQTLARLADVDAANAEAYLRRLIINILRFPDPAQSEVARNARIDALLTRIQSAGRLNAAEAARFAASIYTSGGRLDEALVQHRRALALAPNDIDALLEYTTAQKARGDVAQAATLLQYKAETATDEAGFAAAVNGLLDVLASGGDGGSAVPADVAQGRLGWARRATFERMLMYGDDVRLSSLVGDISQDRGDLETQLRALQSSLAVAGDQRPAVLRQLIALTSPNENGTGDAARKVVYGRRLVAMRKPYPPEVYADLARVFLEQGDIAGAERAFALVGDMGGLVNVEELRGQAYAAVGRNGDALASYRLALLQDQDNLDLLSRTAELMEAEGQTDEANRLYWKALTLLVQRQPPRLVGDAPPNLDAAQYGPTLIEGLLLTWPQSNDADRLANWRATFDAAVASAKAAGAAPNLADAPRLALAVTVNRRLASALKRPALIQAEAPVQAIYGDDPQFRRILAAYQADTITATIHVRPLDDLRRQVARSEEFELDLVLAFEAGDRMRIRRMLVQAIAEDAPWRAARETGAAGVQPGGLIVLLMKAADFGSPAMLRDDILPPLLASGFSDAVFFDLYRIDPERLGRFEAAVGRRLIDDETLIRFLVARGGDPLPTGGAAGRRRGGPGPVEQVAKRFDEDRLIRFYETLVERMEQTGEVSGLQDAIADYLLNRPLSAARRDRFQTVLIRDISGDRVNVDNSVTNFTDLLLRLDAPDANRSILLQAAKAAAVRYPDGARLPEVLSAWFDGNRAASFEALISLIEQANAQNNIGLQTLLRTRFSAEREEAFAAFLARSSATREETARFQRRFLGDALRRSTVDPTALAAYRRLVAFEPGNTAYVAALMTLQARLGDFAGLVETARPYVASHAEDEEASTVLGLAYRLTGDEDAATQVAQTSSIDLDDADWISQLSTRASQPRSGAGDMLGAFGPTWTTYRNRFPDSPAVRVLALAEDTGAQVESAGSRPLDRLVAAPDGPDAAREILRGLWRDTTPRGREEGDTAARQALIDALADPVAAQYDSRVADALVRRSDVTAELEAELAVLPPQAQGRQMRLYALVARGLSAQGAVAARRAELEAELGGDPMSVHDLSLYLALVNESSAALDAATLEGLLRQLRATPSPSAGLRLATARVTARAGDLDMTEGLLQAAFLQTLYPSPSTYLDPGDPPLTPAVFVDALSLLPDPSDRRRAYDALRAIRERQAERASISRWGDLPPLPQSVTR
jgi:predicted Zn-dependent protease